MTFRMPATVRSAHGKIRRRDAGFEPLQRRLHEDVIQRELLDKDYEDDVFDVAAGKRDAELANMRLGSKGIGPTDPRRQSLETFFQDPAHQKGSRSRAAKGPGPGRRDPAAAR